MFSTAFHNDWVGSGIPRGGARGGLCPLRTRKILKPGSLQMPFPGIYDDCYVFIKQLHLCKFSQDFGMGGGQILYLQTNGFFHPTRKVN